MSARTDGFEAFLAEDESVVHVAPGTLLEDGHGSEGSIGVTDRRVLFLADGDRFVDVTHDAVYSIRSRSRTRFTRGGIGYRLLAATGAVVAAAAFLGLIAFGASLPALGFSVLVVGGTLGAESVRRGVVDVDRSRLARFVEGRFDDSGDGGKLRRLIEVAAYGDGDPLVLSLAYVTTIALVGLVAVTGSLVVIPFVVVTLGGVAIADHALRRKRALDTIGGSRYRDREVSLYLADGRTVRIRVDADDPFDRLLSGVAREPVLEEAPSELSRH